MKTILLIILILIPRNSGAIFVAADTISPSIAQPVWIFQETFEGAIACNTTMGCDNSGWTTLPGSGGTVDYDYPIGEFEPNCTEGAECLFIEQGNGLAFARSRDFDSTAAFTEACFSFTINDYTPLTGVQESQIILLQETGGTSISFLYLYGGDIFQYGIGATDDTGTFSVLNCLFPSRCYGWTNFTTGSGNATGNFYISASNVRPDTPDISITGATRTNNASKIRFEISTDQLPFGPLAYTIDQINVTNDAGGIPICVP